MQYSVSSFIFIGILLFTLKEFFISLFQAVTSKFNIKDFLIRVVWLLVFGYVTYISYLQI